MKKILVLFLVFFTGNVLSENTVIAVVNSTPISLNSVQSEIFPNKSKEEIIEELNAQIYMALQLQKVSEFDLWSTQDDINQVLIDIAKDNDLSMEELLNFEEIDLIKNEISEKLSILNLQRFITSELEKPTQEILNQCSNVKLEDDLKQIKIAQIIISEIDSDTQNPEQKNASIKSFLNKLSNHISKGASFETFAKLHSQHPSYKDGEQLRDFIYVKDVVEVCHFLLNHRKDSGIYNLGTGTARTFLDLVKSTFNALKISPNISFIDTPEDIRDKYQYFTEAKMSKLISAGYTKRFASLEEGVADYVSQYLKPNEYL